MKPETIEAIKQKAIERKLYGVLMSDFCMYIEDCIREAIQHPEILALEGYHKLEWVSVEDRLPEIVNKKSFPVLVLKENKFRETAYYFADKFISIEFEDWDDYDEEHYPYTEHDKENGIIWLKSGWYQKEECSCCDTVNWNPIKVTHWQPLPSPPKQ